MQPLEFRHDEVPGLVTIVTPSRNGARFLGETLGGIAAQTHRDWELVLVEDGSRDGTEELVRRFAREHPGRRVVYLRNEASCGPAYARNVAFLEARGEYIALLDCDDRWLPTHLASCLEALRASGDDLAYSTAVMFADSDSRLTGLWGPTRSELEAFPQSLFARCFVTPSATVVRRRVVGEVGAWDSTYRCCEDFDFVMRAVGAGVRFRHVPGVHCLYRKEHAGAATQQMAEIMEVYAIVASRYRGMEGVRRGTAARGIASSLELAAKMHARRRIGSDPSRRPERAALLYYRAWRLRPKRLKNLLRAALCLMLHGAGRGVQGDPRPSLPPVEPAVAPARRVA